MRTVFQAGPVPGDDRLTKPSFFDYDPGRQQFTTTMEYSNASPSFQIGLREIR